MHDRYLLITIVAFLFLATGCDNPVSQTLVEQPPRTGPDAVRGAALFRECSVCHIAAKDGPKQIGPNLWGVYGAPAGNRNDFAYSRAMRRAEFIWDDAQLDAYLTSPQSIVPGGRMAYQGMKNAESRADIIAYLATRTDTPNTDQ